jgi:hypothetical protein
MDNQTLFDTCLTHMRQQGQRATSARGYCRYRNDTGLKCAIGALIPDDKYHPNFEMHAVHDRLVALAAGLTSNQIDLAKAIQRNMHDDIFDRSGDFFVQLENAAYHVARHFNLEYSA